MMISTAPAGLGLVPRPGVNEAAVALRELRLDDAIAISREALEEDPRNFAALLCLGIALTRVGLAEQGLKALYRASMQRPPSWEAFQMVSMWTRAAERAKEGSFSRAGGAAPPRVVVRLLERLSGRTAAPDAVSLVPPPPQAAALRSIP